MDNTAPLTIQTYAGNLPDSFKQYELKRLGNAKKSPIGEEIGVTKYVTGVEGLHVIFIPKA